MHLEIAPVSSSAKARERVELRLVRTDASALLYSNRTQGIRARHSRSCPAKTGGGCKCKPSYEAFVYDFGARRLSDLSRLDVQDFAERMLAEGRDASTIRNTLMPQRAICRRALSRGELTVNPTSGLELPAVRGKRDRIVSPDEAGKLLAALPEEDRGLWATALYAGLRRGELLSLRFEDIDLAGGRIKVARAFDPVACVIVAPKSASGLRSVPVPSVLREYLAAQRLRAGRGEGLAFGENAGTPFDSLRLTRRAHRIWQGAGLTPIGL